MTKKSRLIAPPLVVGAIGVTTATLLRRMEVEYANQDTLSKSTVAAMYCTYSAYASALVWAGRRRVWPVQLPARPSRVTGTALAVAGSGIAVAGASLFGGGAEISGTKPEALHTHGIYRYSRNPQYLGLGLAATGVAIAARSAFSGLLAAGVWAVYRRWIPNEERHLTRIFGNEYLNYQVNAGRWL